MGVWGRGAGLLTAIKHRILRHNFNALSDAGNNQNSIFKVHIKFVDDTKYQTRSQFLNGC